MSNTGYEIVLADPPWMERGAGKSKRGADKHYPLMKTADIIDLWDAEDFDDRVAPDAFLFLWVTDNFLEDGLAVMDEWGFEYKRTFVWCKPSFGIGFYARGQHEICLLGVRGSPPRSRRPGGGSGGHTVAPSVLHADKGKHSKKPEAFYEIVESFKSSPDARCLELFARNTRRGWDSWGNDVS